MLIENSVTRVLVRRHQACRVMPNSYPSDGFFNLHRRNIMDSFFFFFLHTLPLTIAFKLEYVLFYQFYAKITTFFDQEKFGMAPLLYTDVETFGGNWCENNVKTSKRHQNVKIVVLTSCTRVVLHPSCKTTFPSPVGLTEIPVGYARINISEHPELTIPVPESSRHKLALLII